MLGRFSILGIGMVLFFGSCEKTEIQEDPFVGNHIFPVMPVPEDNTFTEDRWELGKRLFNDPVLSVDSTVSCGSCHKPNLAFADSKKISPGVDGRLALRNAATLANIGYAPYLLSEGGVPTLEMQVLVPIQEHEEMDFNIVLVAERLKMNPFYVDLAKKAYDREIDPFVITRSISVYERSMVSKNSNYDQYANGDREKLNSSQIAGMNLFFSNKTNCFSCHMGFNFTSYGFHNNGIEYFPEDNGRMRFTGLEEDKGLFKTPTLRNIEVTGPYMHDGRFNSLKEVIEHYNSGGHDVPNKSPLIRPLGLSEKEKEDLESFLRSLTDQSFITDPRWNP